MYVSLEIESLITGIVVFVSTAFQMKCFWRIPDLIEITANVLLVA